MRLSLFNISVDGRQEYFLTLQFMGSKISLQKSGRSSFVPLLPYLMQRLAKNYVGLTDKGDY